MPPSIIPSVWCGIIADGHHVDPKALRTALRAKRGEGKLFFVTDAMSLVGSEQDSFTLNGRTVRRERGGFCSKLVLSDGTLAGSDVDMVSTIRYGVTYLELPLAEALRMATLYPARFLRLEGRGHLLAGCPRRSGALDRCSPGHSDLHQRRSGLEIEDVMTAITDAYFSNLIGRLETLKTELAEPMALAANAILEAARNDKRVYVFGTGHSHMLAEEVHYRAGGLAFTVPVLVGSAMLHEGAVISSVYERTEGLVRPVLERYGMQPGDVIIIASNSGVNAAPIEAADYGHEIGAKVIAITSVSYSSAVANGRRRLADIADIVLDNGLPPAMQ